MTVQPHRKEITEREFVHAVQGSCKLHPGKSPLTDCSFEQTRFFPAPRFLNWTRGTRQGSFGNEREDACSRPSREFRKGERRRSNHGPTRTFRNRQTLQT